MTSERSILMGRRIKFDEVFGLLEEYKEEYGNCNVRCDYKTSSGILLGRIVNRIRTGERRTTPEEKAKLDSIGFVWRVHEMFSFEEIFKMLEEYQKEYGHCIVPQGHKTASGVSLGTIVNNIRAGVRNITDEEKVKLNSIGFAWKVHEKIPFEEVIRLLEEYQEEYGHCIVPRTHKTLWGIPLGKIVHNIRTGRRNTTPEEKAKLDSIGFVWKVRIRKKQPKGG